MLRATARLSSGRFAGRLISRPRVATALPSARPSEPRGLCTVNFTFIEEGEEVPVTVEAGKSILEAAHENEIDLEGAPAIRARSRRPAIAPALPAAGRSLAQARPRSFRRMRWLSRVLHVPRGLQPGGVRHVA